MTLLTPFRFQRFRAASSAVVLGLLCSGQVAFAADDAPGAYRDDPREPGVHAAAVIAAGEDAKKLTALEQELAAVVTNAKLTRLERQAAAEHLGYVLLAGAPGKKSPALTRVGALLAQDEGVEFARLALDQVPGKAVDAVYVDALKKARGATRIALAQSLGSRGASSAVAGLKSLLSDNDPDTQLAAIRALGAIGGPDALAALKTVPKSDAPAVFDARLAAAVKAGQRVQRETAQAIYRDPTVPVAQRAAALRVLLSVAPDEAGSLVNEALQRTESEIVHASLAAVPALQKREDIAQLVATFDKLPASVQIPLLAALARSTQREPVAAALPGIVERASEAEVRLAALDAMGTLTGGGTGREVLARLAAGSDVEAKAAATALARLSYRDADAEIRRGAAEGDAKLRGVYIAALAARNQTAELPFLLGLRNDPALAVRLAALDALRDIAPPAQQQAVIEWAVGAKDRTEQNRAIRALITIILRDDDAAARVAPVVRALEAGDPAARAVLLPVLSRVGGPQAFAAAEKFARDADATVAAAAVAELSRWSDATALPVLVDVAQKATQPAVRDAAARGATGFLARGDGIARADRSAQTRALLTLPLGSPEKNALLYVLGLCGDQDALAVAKTFAAEPATADAARDAIDALTSTLAGAPKLTASGAEESLPNILDGKNETTWSIPNEPGGWLRADLHHSRPVRKVTVDPGNGRGWGYPATIEILVSDDPENPGEVRATAEGERGATVVSLPAGIRGRYLWIRQTGTRDAPWWVAELAIE